MHAYYPERLDEIMNTQPLPPMAVENREIRSSEAAQRAPSAPAYRQGARASLNPARLMQQTGGLPVPGERIAVTGTIVRAPQGIANSARSAVIQAADRFYDVSTSSLQHELAQNIGKRILVEGRVARVENRTIVIDVSMHSFSPEAR